MMPLIAANNILVAASAGFRSWCMTDRLVSIHTWKSHLRKVRKNDSSSSNSKALGHLP